MFGWLACLCPQADAGKLSGLPQWISQARRITGLKGRSLDDVLPVFASASDAQGHLSRSSFASAFSSFIEPGVLAAEKREIATLLNAMFDAFDNDHNGYVDFSELCAGLTLLCGSSQDDRVKSMFKLLDKNGDGTISMEVRWLLLCCVCAKLSVQTPLSLCHRRSRCRMSWTFVDGCLDV